MARPKKKSVVDKVVDAVDNFIHPDHKEKEEVVSKKVVNKESRAQASDYENHPKFAKFKNKGVL